MDFDGLKTTLVPILSSGLARLISKALMVYCGYEAGTASNSSQLYANSIMVLVVGAAELIQSKYAHKETAKKAIESVI